MNRIDALIAELCPEGVEYRMLGVVGEFIRGNGLQKGDLTDSGVGAIHYGQIHTIYGVSTKMTKSFVSEEMARKLRKALSGDLVIATTSEDDASVAKAVAWVGEGEIAVSGDAYIYRHSLVAKICRVLLSDRTVPVTESTVHFRHQGTTHIRGKPRENQHPRPSTRSTARNREGAGRIHHAGGGAGGGAGGASAAVRVLSGSVADV